MFKHTKVLQYPAKPERPDPVFAKKIQQKRQDTDPRFSVECLQFQGRRYLSANGFRIDSPMGK
ncbi:hypothetical protein DT075_06720 [Bacillus licheniformis]|nr:hypothetical protein DT075_06720 [Bacillus licheniformis]